MYFLQLTYKKTQLIRFMLGHKKAPIKGLFQLIIVFMKTHFAFVALWVLFQINPWTPFCTRTSCQRNCSSLPLWNPPRKNL